MLLSYFSFHISYLSVEKYSKHAILAVKDEYNFDFLEINEEHLERELEKDLIENIRKFLIEMGGDFCFIGSQYRVEIDENRNVN